MNLVNKAIKNLKINRMNGYYIENKEELFSLLDNLIPNKCIVGTGDSLTLEQLDVYQYLREKDIDFLDKYDKNITKQEKKDIYIKNFSSDVFITGTNALSAQGEIFNIDGNGSRVAPMIYGPSKVILVVGINKLVLDKQEAYDRVRQHAAPLDAIRLKKETPCTKLESCIDCRHPQRICNDFVLITSQFDSNRIHVIIYNDILGF
ncbi:MAG: lactate utilization protein [Erysipelotrichales bacterium]